MNILIMAQHYAPEEVSGAVLATELATDLVKCGHKVSFITCAPNYPEGKVFSGYRNSLVSKEKLDGVNVIRTWSYISPRKTFWRRILNFGTFSVGAFFTALVAGKPNIILSFSPPLPLGISAWILSRFWNVPWILRVEDLYPEAAVAMGVLRNHITISLLSAVERFLYHHANHISLISEGFRENLLSKGIPLEKLSVIPVWGDPNNIPVLPKENNFRQGHGLHDKFLVIYAGNLGHTSALEEVILAAERLSGVPDTKFVIIGEGVKKSALEKLTLQKMLDNVLFLPYQPRPIFAEELAAADVGLVTLNKNSSKSSLPSKIFNIMASGRPILAVAPLESEVCKLAEEGGCGVCVPPGHPDLIANAILELKRNKNQLKDMGTRGRLWLETHFSRNGCVNMYETMLKRVARWG